MGSKGVARRGLIALFFCAAVACGHRAAHDLRVALSLDPVTPTAGTASDVRVTLADDQARPLRGARLQVEAHMSHPGMAPLVADGLETGDGIYTAHIPFPMAGEWTLVVTGVLADGRRIAAQVERADVRPAP